MKKGILFFIILVSVSTLLVVFNITNSSFNKIGIEPVPNLSYNEPVKLFTSEIDIGEIDNRGDYDKRYIKYAIYNSFTYNLTLEISSYCEDNLIANITPIEPSITLLNESQIINSVQITSLKKGSTKCKIVFNNSFYRDLELIVNVKEVDKKTEQIKCVFNDPSRYANCVSYKDRCEGISSCVVNVTGIKGTEIEWASVCEGKENTIIDGINEIIEFECDNIKCTDTDGGKDYYAKGTIETFDGSNNNVVDRCDTTFANSNLLEFYCSDINESSIISSEPYLCPNGCEDGACIQ